MKVLILGGTVFVGRHIVDVACERGHEVTLFNRGQETSAVSGVEMLKGDRRGDLHALQHRQWDAVIDVVGYVPSVVERAARTLADQVGHYSFVSTRAVYADDAASNETDPVATMTDDEVLEAEAIVPTGRSQAKLYGRHYGALKARCEAAAERGMPGRVLVVRPGLVVGPWDSTDRFTYWVRRVSEGGEVLAPGRPGRVVRFIDVRDLAAFLVARTEDRTTGVFNAGGLDGATMGSLLAAMCLVSQSATDFVWASDAFLLERGVEPWSDLPLWLPEQDNSFFERPDDKAKAHGLMYRTMESTIEATLRWDRSRGATELIAGMDRARESELIAAARQGG